MATPQWPSRIIQSLGREPRVGDWYTEGNYADLYPVETQRRLNQLLLHCQHPDCSGRFFSTLDDSFQYFMDRRFDPPPTSILVKRWWYLVTRGMWRGESTVEIRDEHGISIIASGRKLPNQAYPTFRNYKVWWKRSNSGNR